MTTPQEREEARAKAQTLREGFNFLKAKSTNIDRRLCRRDPDRPMQILCLGLSRTGTASLRAALLELGYFDVYHIASIMTENHSDSDMWCEAIDAKFYGKGIPYGREQWDKLLGHCMAVTDTPCVLFARELVAAYPFASIILSVRDSADQWRTSTSATILSYVHVTLSSTYNPLLYLFRVLQTPHPIDKMFARIFPSQPWNALNAAPDMQEGRRKYHEHNAMVRKLAGVGDGVRRTEKFLEFNVKEGWGPLCTFLGKEVPDTPFPKVNDTAELRSRFRILYVLMSIGAVGNALKYLAPVLAVAVGWWVLRARL